MRQNFFTDMRGELTNSGMKLSDHRFVQPESERAEKPPGASVIRWLEHLVGNRPARRSKSAVQLKDMCQAPAVDV